MAGRVPQDRQQYSPLGWDDSKALRQIAVSQEAAALLLSLSVRTIRRLTNENKIPHRRVGPGSIIYPVEELKRLAAEGDETSKVK